MDYSPAPLLHLVGSLESGFFADLSAVYAKDCIAAEVGCGNTDQLMALAKPNGIWLLFDSVEDWREERAQPADEAGLQRWMASNSEHVVLPHMFCYDGMTRCRQLALNAGLTMVGNLPTTMATAANKWHTREAVQDSGVSIPEAELLTVGDKPTQLPPYVVKPVDADNSVGVSLVRTEEETDSALSKAFAESQSVVAERYIPLGREVRCGVIERESEPTPTALQEYDVDEQSCPIRPTESKLVRDESGQLDLASKKSRTSWIIAEDDPISSAVQAAAIRCHEALGCRHYSLFDFRVDPTGKPWLLEAGLYCSFASNSVLVAMAEATGIPRAEFLREMVRLATQNSDLQLLQSTGTCNPGLRP
ncbi:MAG: ATP-grasp domain-containing protein [Planctomycetota bacterium]